MRGIQILRGHGRGRRRRRRWTSAGHALVGQNSRQEHADVDSRAAGRRRNDDARQRRLPSAQPARRSSRGRHDDSPEPHRAAPVGHGERGARQRAARGGIVQRDRVRETARPRSDDSTQRPRARRSPVTVRRRAADGRDRTCARHRRRSSWTSDEQPRRDDTATSSTSSPSSRPKATPSSTSRTSKVSKRSRTALSCCATDARRARCRPARPRPDRDADGRRNVDDLYPSRRRPGEPPRSRRSGPIGDVRAAPRRIFGMPGRSAPRTRLLRSIRPERVAARCASARGRRPHPRDLGARRRDAERGPQREGLAADCRSPTT